MDQGTRPTDLVFPRPAGRAWFLFPGRGRGPARADELSGCRVPSLCQIQGGGGGLSLVECFASISCIEIEISSLLFFEESSSPQKTRDSGLADILD